MLTALLLKILACKSRQYIKLKYMHSSLIVLCYSYNMGCPPVRGDNPRALASGLSYVQVDSP